MRSSASFYNDFITPGKRALFGDLKEIDPIVNDIDSINTWTLDYSYLSKMVLMDYPRSSSTC